jgi:hypothetical protein
MDQQRHFHDTDTARWAETAKTPETHLGSSVLILMRLAQVDSYLDLTQFWQDASRELKAQQQCNVLQRALDKAMAICCVLGGNRTHIVTPSLAKNYLTVEFFRMTNPDDLSTGIQPFILVQTMATKWQQAQALIHIYDTVMGGATATVTDA